MRKQQKKYQRASFNKSDTSAWYFRKIYARKSSLVRYEGT